MKEKHAEITRLLSLLTFAAFALCVLLVLLRGAGIYRDLVTQSEENHNRRTAQRYIATRVRQAEAVALEDFQGCQALVLREELDGEIYLTRVYCHEGFLRELYCPEEANLSPDDGETVIPAQSLGFSLEGNVLTVALDADRLWLYLRTGQEVAP